LDVLDGLLETARYEFSCFGEYDSPAYGTVTDGVLGNRTKRELGAWSLRDRDAGDRWLL
jgi:hypothetical protein